VLGARSSEARGEVLSAERALPAARESSSGIQQALEDSVSAIGVVVFAVVKSSAVVRTSPVAQVLSSGIEAEHSSHEVAGSLVATSSIEHAVSQVVRNSLLVSQRSGGRGAEGSFEFPCWGVAVDNSAI
jgi:hypothetical protein